MVLLRLGCLSNAGTLLLRFGCQEVCPRLHIYGFSRIFWPSFNSKRNFAVMEHMLTTAYSVGKEKYPNKLNKCIEYGTAGFRTNATALLHVMYRMGLLSVLRSKALKGSTIGIMITASHNPEEDNGVKLCDPLGEMLVPSWEVLATKLANADDDSLCTVLVSIIKTQNIDVNSNADVFLARDTRPSSWNLSNAVAEGVKVLEGQIKDYGILTTPQLHYMVCCKNTNNRYGDETPVGYYKKLSSAFLYLWSQKDQSVKYSPHIYIDGANGVGACALKELIPYLDDSLKIHIFNDGLHGKLNHMCGADYVKVQQKVPEGTEVMPCHRYASLDGDADRLIYFYLDAQNAFRMLDGDKIAVLIAKYLKLIVKQSGLDLEFCVVQTAYANGSSTQYIENILKIPVVCVPTGVKYLHHEAKKYNIGIYFEANGHGTVLFQDEVKRRIKDFKNNSTNTEDGPQVAVQKLVNVIDLINETVGDAVSDMLVVETILHDIDWDISDWDSLYVDLPCRQLKVKVPDPKKVTTTDAGRICVTPAGLQNVINSLVQKYNNARAFVRPSGTEDIVRVYAEADTQEHADSLAQQIAMKVQELV